MKEKINNHEHPRPPKGMEELCIDGPPLKAGTSPCRCGAKAQWIRNSRRFLVDLVHYHCSGCKHEWTELFPHKNYGRVLLDISPGEVGDD